jgi:hypothetical protein
LLADRAFAERQEAVQRGCELVGVVVVEVTRVTIVI